MSGGLVGLLDDDAAGMPRYVHGLAAEQELPIIKRIAKGSLKKEQVARRNGDEGPCAPVDQSDSFIVCD